MTDTTICQDLSNQLTQLRRIQDMLVEAMIENMTPAEMEEYLDDQDPDWESKFTRADTELSRDDVIELAFKFYKTGELRMGSL